MNYIYVLDEQGKPLMPTTRCGKVRRMLKDGRAVAVSTKPFVVRLTYEPKTRATQEICAGIDPGRTNIGLTAVRGDGQCLYRAHVTTRNKDVPRLVAERAKHRHASRRGERHRRQRRAKANGTEFMCFGPTAMGTRPEGKMKNGHFTPTKQRHLPGYSDDGSITLHGITNSEARFNNRRRPEGWLSPTAAQLLLTHLNVIKLMQKILPVTDVCVELNKFAFMALDDPDIWRHRVDFQNGPLKGCSGKNAAVDAMQGGKCLMCGGPIECHHHILPRHEYGGNTFENIVGLCNECHTKVHTNETARAELDTLHGKRNKKYGALSVLNQIIPRLMKEIKGMGLRGIVYAVRGYETAHTREKLGLKKDHDLDAYCIAMQMARDKFDISRPGACDVFPDSYEVRQFRRHDRAIIRAQRERTYRHSGTVIAKNRNARTEQKGPSLKKWVDEQAYLHGAEEAEHMISALTAVKSKRRYNSAERVMPGAVFTYKGRRYVMAGQLSNGKYYRACGCGEQNFPSADCIIIRQNAGLVYV